MELSKVLAGLFLSTYVMVAPAEEIHLGKEVSKQQIIDILSPRRAKDSPNTRGISLQKNRIETSSSNKRAVAIDIYFEFNSYELLDSAEAQLRPLGEALKSAPLANISFTLEGHTDAVGDDDYNLLLSEKRAVAVKSYLAREYEIDASRIRAIGMGESALFDKDNPDSGVNRRVTIVAY